MGSSPPISVRSVAAQRATLLKVHPDPMNTVIHGTECSPPQVELPVSTSFWSNDIYAQKFASSRVLASICTIVLPI
jgi:hypothetical protein